MFYFNSNIAGKDMFLVPKYLSDYLGAKGEIVYPKWAENADFGNEYRGVKLVPIRSLSKFHSTLWSEKEMIWWLLKNSKNIDVLCLFWLNPRNIFFANIYKMLNRKGVCYVKADLGYTDFTKISVNGIKGYFKNYFSKVVDIYSVETERNYLAIKDGALGDQMKNSTVFMSNGFDIELFEKFNIAKRDFNEKESLLITVGRIGHKEKNNEMMLQALDGIDMMDWKFMLVGNIEDDFLNVFEDFILRNPDKKDKVILTGGIYDREKLWDIYNRAKAFVLTSPKEGMPIVFSEALAFGNFIITTNVSGSSEISDNGRLGKIVDVGDVDALRIALCDLFTGKLDLETNYKSAIKLSDAKFNWRKLVEAVGDRIKHIKEVIILR